MEFGKEYFEHCKNHHNFDMMQKGGWQKYYVIYITSLFNLKKAKCLDFGCAMGAQTSAFVDYNIDMVGVDVSDFYIENSPFENLKGRLFSYTDKLPFEDNTFDFIHSSQVIEHIPEDKMDSVLSELKRVLKPNGLIFLATCGKEDPSHEGNDPTHVNTKSSEEWIECLTKHFDDRSNTFRDQWEDQEMYQDYKWVQFVMSKKEELPFAEQESNIGEPVKQVVEDIEIADPIIPSTLNTTQDIQKKRGRKRK